MKYTFELCAGRHETPATVAIFPGELNPLDVQGMYTTADEAIPTDCTNLVLYATGLSVALLAVVQVAIDRGITLTAMHFDRESGKYYPQHVTRFFFCPFCGGRIPGTEYWHSSHCPHCGAS